MNLPQRNIKVETVSFLFKRRIKFLNSSSDKNFYVFTYSVILQTNIKWNIKRNIFQALRVWIRL